jgi:protein-disulfide isomerase
MENRNMTDNDFTQDRLRTLDPVDWTPDAAAAMAGLRRREKSRRMLRGSWIWASAIVSMAGLLLIVAPAPATCAVAGIGCPNTAKNARNYKVEGSPEAPVTIEIFSDYECPYCAVFYQTVYPQLVSEFVKTGKVRIVHRDFPLPQHPYAGLAARSADAAGELGEYNLVASTLFRTQQQWASTGNVDGAVAQVLPPGTMQQVRSCVKDDSAIERSIAADVALVPQDQIDQTPTLIITAKGQSHKLAGAQSWVVLKAYLNELLK